MKTQTQVSLHIKNLQVGENLEIQPSGFVIRIFLSCNRVDTKVFKVNSAVVKIDQMLKIKNIVAEELEFWLCTTNNKIIAVGKCKITQDSEEHLIEFKMTNTDFGKLQTTIDVNTYEIEKQVIIEPDQELLKKEEDPQQKIRKEEEQKRKAIQAADLLEASKAKKKPAITLTQYKKKDQPFL